MLWIRTATEVVPKVQQIGCATDATSGYYQSWQSINNNGSFFCLTIFILFNFQGGEKQADCQRIARNEMIMIDVKIEGRKDLCFPIAHLKRDLSRHHLLFQWWDSRKWIWKEISPSKTRILLFWRYQLHLDRVSGQAEVRADNYLCQSKQRLPEVGWLRRKQEFWWSYMLCWVPPKQVLSSSFCLDQCLLFNHPFASFAMHSSFYELAKSIIDRSRAALRVFCVSGASS